MIGLNRAGMPLTTANEKGGKLASPRGCELFASRVFLPIWLHRAA